MNAKEFFTRFHWGVVFPAVLTFAAGIAVMAAPESAYLARSVTVGILFALAAICTLAAFFLDLEGNPVRLIAGVASASAAVWMFITVTTPLKIFCIAMGVVTVLRLGGDVFDAIKRDGGKRRIVRFCVDAVLLALCIVIFCDPFSFRTLLLFTGGTMLAETLYSLVIAFLTGVMEPEAPRPRTWRK